MPILGAIFLRNVLAVFNVGASKMRFAARGFRKTQALFPLLATEIARHEQKRLAGAKVLKKPFSLPRIVQLFALSISFRFIATTCKLRSFILEFLSSQHTHSSAQKPSRTALLPPKIHEAPPSPPIQPSTSPSTPTTISSPLLSTIQSYLPPPRRLPICTFRHSAPTQHILLLLPHQALTYRHDAIHWTAHLLSFPSLSY